MTTGPPLLMYLRCVYVCGGGNKLAILLLWFTSNNKPKYSLCIFYYIGHSNLSWTFVVNHSLIHLLIYQTADFASFIFQSNLRHAHCVFFGVLEASASQFRGVFSLLSEPSQDSTFHLFILNFHSKNSFNGPKGGSHMELYQGYTEDVVQCPIPIQSMFL